MFHVERWSSENIWCDQLLLQRKCIYLSMWSITKVYTARTWLPCHGYWLSCPLSRCSVNKNWIILAQNWGKERRVRAKERHKTVERGFPPLLNKIRPSPRWTNSLTQSLSLSLSSFVAVARCFWQFSSERCTDREGAQKWQALWLCKFGAYNLLINFHPLTQFKFTKPNKTTPKSVKKQQKSLPGSPEMMQQAGWRARLCFVASPIFATSRSFSLSAGFTGSCKNC